MALSKVMNGKSYIHDIDGVFTEKSSAEAHADYLKRQYKFVGSTKIEDKGNNVWWVWWSYK